MSDTLRKLVEKWRKEAYKVDIFSERSNVVAAEVAMSNMRADELAAALDAMEQDRTERPSEPSRENTNDDTHHSGHTRGLAGGSDDGPTHAGRNAIGISITSSHSSAAHDAGLPYSLVAGVAPEGSGDRASAEAGGVMEPTVKSRERPNGEVPWPKSLNELTEYIEQMRAWPNDRRAESYGACVYAMANASLATFRYMASQLGATGFQASCADMEFLVQNRGYANGMMLLNAEDLLYPQYDLKDRVEKWIAKSRVKLAPVAATKLVETSSNNISVAVRARWEEIAALREPPDAD